MTEEEEKAQQGIGLLHHNQASAETGHKQDDAPLDHQVDWSSHDWLATAGGHSHVSLHTIITGRSKSQVQMAFHIQPSTSTNEGVPQV
jgi:hypothetical protein